MNVHIIIVGSAIPRISKGLPPIIDYIIPHNAVDAKVLTSVSTPSGNCWNTENKKLNCTISLFLHLPNQLS